MTTEIETARAALKALQTTGRQSGVTITKLQAQVDAAEAAVRDSEAALAAAQRNVAQATGDDLADVATRQAECETKLRAAQIVVETLQKALAAERERAASHDDAIMLAAEKIFAPQIDALARDVAKEVESVRNKVIELRTLANSCLQLDWTVLPNQQRVKLSRPMKYGQETLALFGDMIAHNLSFAKPKADAIGAKWATHFAALQADADAVMPTFD